MDVRFVPVETAEDRCQIAQLASRIWNEYWPAIIGQAQTDYMVENFQSLSAFERDMAEHGYEYWFVMADGEDGQPQVDTPNPRRIGSSSRRSTCWPSTGAAVSPVRWWSSTTGCVASGVWAPCT